MRFSPRIAIALTVLLVGCGDTIAFVPPPIDCSITDAYTVYLERSVRDASATTKALRAKYRLQILDTFGTLHVADGVTGFLARMTPSAAHGVAGEDVVAFVEHWTCQGPVAGTVSPVAQPPSLQ